MNYWVIMNEQQTMIIDNVDFILMQEGVVTFHDKDGGYLAAFQLKDIVGFMRMNEPKIEMPEYKWDFGTVAEPPEKQEEPTIHVDFYTDLTRKAREEYEGRDVSIGEVHDEMVEVMEEGMERRIVPDGGTIPLLVRKELNQRIRKATNPEEIKQLDKALRRNMNDCLGIE